VIRENQIAGALARDSESSSGLPVFTNHKSRFTNHEFHTERCNDARKSKTEKGPRRVYDLGGRGIV
jgi:hypothetical protein